MHHLIPLKLERVIRDERRRQDALWGGPTHDDEHALEDWIIILTRELGLATPRSAGQPMSEEDQSRWERQMVRIAATAQAALESYYRQRPELLEKVIVLKTDPGY